MGGFLGPHHVLIQNGLQCLRPLANRERPRPGVGVAGDGQKFVGSAGNIDFKPLFCVHGVVAGLVVGKTGGFEKNPHTLPAGAGFGVRLHCGNNVKAHFGKAPVRCYAIVNVNGTQAVKHPHTQAVISAPLQGVHGLQVAGEGAGVVGHSPAPGSGVVRYFGRLCAALSGFISPHAPAPGVFQLLGESVREKLSQAAAPSVSPPWQL